MLTFEALRTANVARCEESYHPIDDWSPTDWACAMAGECGEACNEVKKLRRAETSKIDRNMERTDRINLIADELADLIIYVDLLAARLDIDLSHAVMSKFDLTSSKIGSSQLLYKRGNNGP